MSIRVRMTLCFFIVLAVVPLSFAKDKKKQVLPNYVLKAQTVAVVIRPEAGEPLTSPAANRTAQVNVMNALAKWGRFRVVSDAQTADLIVAVQKGHANGPTIHNSPVDSQPVTLEGGVPPADGGVPPAGVSRRSPDLSNPGQGRPSGRAPNISNEAGIGMSEDSFEVYMGGVDHPLDSTPVWRYVAKDGLNSPQMTAVQQFRNAVNESDQLSQQKP
jgi:hypothetical protein